MHILSVRVHTYCQKAQEAQLLKGSLATVSAIEAVGLIQGHWNNSKAWVRYPSAIATVEATEAAASVKVLTGAIIISVIKITIVTFNANSTI